MKKRTISINHSLTYYVRREDSTKCEFRVSEPKTAAGVRTIPMMKPVYEALKSEYERQEEEGYCIANIDGMTNFIFTNRFGNPHNPQAVNRAIKRIVDAHNAEEEVAAKKEKREYARGASLYSMNYYSFVNLAKAAGANIQIKKKVIVDLDILEKYIEEQCREEGTENV